MNNDLNETALRIFCAQAGKLLANNDTNLRHNRGLIETAFELAKLFHQVAEKQNESIRNSTNQSNS